MSKGKARTKKSQKVSEKTTIFSTSAKYLMAIIVALGFVAAFSVYAKAQLEKSPFLASPTPIALPTFTPIPVTPTPTVDPNPIITCNINVSCGGGSKQLRQSVCNNMICCLYSTECGGPKFVAKSQCPANGTCCQVGNKWTYYLSKDKCTQDQNAYNSSVNQNNNTYIPSTYTPPTYYTCTLYYPALKLYQTYTSLYKTKAECDSAQASLNQGSQTVQYTAPTTAPYQAPQMTKSQCQASVNDKYGSLMRSYGCYYPCPATGDCGSSSVCEAYWYQAQKDMNSCNQYP